MLYAVLGTFLAMKPSGDVIAGLAPRHRQLLALFLLNPNIAVHRDRLIDLLWNGRPTKSAARNLTTYIAQMRQRLSPRDPTFLHCTPWRAATFFPCHRHPWMLKYSTNLRHRAESLVRIAITTMRRGCSRTR